MDKDPTDPSARSSRAKSLVLRLWPVAAFLLAIFISSSTVIMPKQFLHFMVDTIGLPMSEQGFAAFWSDWWWLFVKGWHATEFAIVFLMLRHVLGSQRSGIASAVTALLGACDEIHQLWVPGRGGHVSDWLIDVMGVATCWYVIAVRAKLSPRQRWVAYAAYLVVALPLLYFLALNPFL